MQNQIYIFFQAQASCSPLCFLWLKVQNLSPFHTFSTNANAWLACRKPGKEEKIFQNMQNNKKLDFEDETCPVDLQKKTKRNALLELVVKFEYIHWVLLAQRNWLEKSHVCENSRNAAIIWFYPFLLKSIEFLMTWRHATNTISTKLRLFSCKSNCTQFLNLWLNCWWHDK